MSRLANRFSRNNTSVRANIPLDDSQIRAVAPSIFAEDKHGSRSGRYTYIPTIDILSGLRKEGFDPFMVCQSKPRDESRMDFTKHMVRLRHASQISKQEANEIILLNSHDGTSSYQMLAGTFRFVCSNGLICGDEVSDVRVPHKGDVMGRVIEGAYTVLNEFDEVTDRIAEMKGLTLQGGEQTAFARAALELRYDDATQAPISADQLLRPRRMADNGADLWSVFNRTQENALRGGLVGRNSNGRPTTTREVRGIDTNVKLNRALWILAEEMARLKN